MLIPKNILTTNQNVSLSSRYDHSSSSRSSSGHDGPESSCPSLILNHSCTGRKGSSKSVILPSFRRTPRHLYTGNQAEFLKYFQERIKTFVLWSSKSFLESSAVQFHDQLSWKSLCRGPLDVDSSSRKNGDEQMKNEQ